MNNLKTCFSDKFNINEGDHKIDFIIIIINSVD